MSATAGRAVAWFVFALAALSVFWWFLVGIGGLSELTPSPEQGGCYLPEPSFGIPLLVIGAVGLVIAPITMRLALATARGRRLDHRYAWGVVAQLFLLAAIAVAYAAKPDSPFGPCP
jgi:hypothetical protein